MSDKLELATEWVVRQKQITDELGVCMVQYHEVKEELLEAKMDLEVSYAKGLAEGDIFGKNADSRKASARDFLEPLYAKVENLEKGERVAKINLDLAQLEASEFRHMLRLLEVFSLEGTYLFPIKSRVDILEETELEEEE